ncbi:hypothetical protein TNCV_258221 [Trichonephila clavipes]|uniref:Uncharacterized protein n=1 Tax=Trichonephila clavipes TaxID=2585209 RepID=A0A8X6V9W4_TRICX|nr:hypothetical protein TNCV_258221 [Trichonephila clavipes]
MQVCNTKYVAEATGGVSDVGSVLDFSGRDQANGVNGSANPASLLNIDMGEITYNPSFKDLNDFEVHHILEDAMFKPSKRFQTRRYSHSQFNETDMKPSSKRNEVRWQLRKMFSDSKRRRRKTINPFPYPGNQIEPINTVYLRSFISSILPECCVIFKTAPSHPEVTVTSAGDSDPDDGGITFTAGNTSPIEEAEQHHRTMAEMILPWKRGDDDHNNPARPQEEFPCWVTNRDYIRAHLSPPPQFLENIPDSRHRSVIKSSIEEEDETSEAENYTQPQTSRPRSDESKSLGAHCSLRVEEHIIKEVMNEACRYRRGRTPEEKRRYFRNSSRKSPDPDRLSLGSIQSEIFSRPTSNLSIECPDVALDIEIEEDERCTKL